MDTSDLADASLDELLDALGAELQEREFGVKFRPARDAARAWLVEHRGTLKDAVCEKTTALYTRGPASDAADAVAAVADLIMGLTLGVPPVTVARIIVKVGLRRFCADAPLPELEPGRA